jgi:hypothetical protein
MKKLTILCALLYICGIAGTSEAALTTFSETFLGTPGDSVTVSSGNTYSFYFDLSGMGKSVNYYQLNNDKKMTAPTSDASGFIPGAFNITSATLSYTLSDGGGNVDTALLKTGASDGSLTLGYHTLNLGKKDTTSFDYTFADSLLSHLSDGKLLVTFTSPDSITLEQLKLDVQAEPVPIPSTAWLFCAGIIGLIGVKRRTGRN